MADAAVEIQFVAQGAEMTQKHIIALQHQLKQLSQTIAAMPKLDIGGANGGDVGFKKEVWREFHNIFAGIEEELDRVVQAINKLNAAMGESASGGTRANTEAIKAQTEAMRDLANTNAMLHEVLIGEAPLNVEIQKTRKGIAVASQDAAKQTESLDKKTVSASKGMRGFGNFTRETASTLANILTPGLGALVNQVNAVVAAFRALITSPIGATVAALGTAFYGVYQWTKKISEQRFEAFESSIRALTRRVEALKRELQGILDMLGRNKPVIDDAPGPDDKGTGFSDAKRRAAQSARSAMEQQEKIHETQWRRVYLQQQLRVAQQKKADAANNIMLENEGWWPNSEALRGYENEVRAADKEIEETRRELQELDILEKELKRNKKQYEDNALEWEKIAIDAQIREAKKGSEAKAKELEEEKRIREEKKRLHDAWLQEDIDNEIRRRIEWQRQLERDWDVQRDVGKDILNTYLSSGGTMHNEQAQALLKMINTSKSLPIQQVAENTRITNEVLREISDRMTGKTTKDLIWARAY